jgi:peptide/nickel transport system substrate-binding protein
MFERLVQFVPETLEYEPWLAKEWSKDGDTATITIKEGYSWHSGQDLTAQDLANHFRIGKIGGLGIWDFIDSVETDDEYTVQFNLSAASTNPTVVLNAALNHLIYTHPELHKEFLERQQDATTEEERNKISQDLLQFKISPEDAYESAGNGIVQLVNTTPTSATFDRYEKHPEIDNMPWAGVKIEDFGSNESAFHEAAIADQIDCFTGSTTQKVRKKMSDHWELVPTPSLGGDCIFFSPNSKWGKDTEQSRKLRQAIAYLYDPTEWRKIYGKNVTELPRPNMVTALPTAEDKNWVPDEILNSLSDYGSDENGWTRPDKAAQMLQEAGFERNSDDVWVDASTGNPLQTTLKFPGGWSGLIPVFRNIAEQLTQFGIKTESLGQENTNYFSTQLPNHNFELAIEGFGGDTGFPYQSFRSSIGSLSKPQIDYNNELGEVAVPWPPGKPEADPQTVNIDERITELSRTTDEDRVRELIGELTWIVNQWVHLVEVEDRLRMHYVATDKWNYDIKPDDPVFHSEQFWAYMTRTGQLNPKQ